MDEHVEGSDATSRDNDSSSPTPKPLGRRLLRLVNEHAGLVGLVASAAGAFIFFIRCFSVTEGDPYTAATLFAQTSLGDAIRALVFVTVPLFIWAAIVSAFMVGINAFGPASPGATFDLPAEKRKQLRRRGAAFVAASVIIFFLGFYVFDLTQLSPGLLETIFWVAILITMIFILGRHVLFSIRFRRGDPQEMRHYRQATSRMTPLVFVASMVIISSVIALAARDFWLPRERLDFKNEAPFTGYVLKVSQDHLIILNDNPRVIVEKHKDTLEDRDFCYPDFHRARTSNVKSDAPVCP